MQIIINLNMAISTHCFDRANIIHILSQIYQMVSFKKINYK